MSGITTSLVTSQGDRQRVRGSVQTSIISLNSSPSLVTQVGQCPVQYGLAGYLVRVWVCLMQINVGSDGTQITLSQSDKWLRQAKVIDGWSVTTTDTAIAFR